MRDSEATIKSNIAKVFDGRTFSETLFDVTSSGGKMTKLMSGVGALAGLGVAGLVFGAIVPGMVAAVGPTLATGATGGALITALAEASFGWAWTIGFGTIGFLGTFPKPDGFLAMVSMPLVIPAALTYGLCRTMGVLMDAGIAAVQGLRGEHAPNAGAFEEGPLAMISKTRDLGFGMLKRMHAHKKELQQDGLSKKGEQAGFAAGCVFAAAFCTVFVASVFPPLAAILPLSAAVIGAVGVVGTFIGAVGMAYAVYNGAKEKLTGGSLVKGLFDGPEKVWRGALIKPFQHVGKAIGAVLDTGAYALGVATGSIPLPPKPVPVLKPEDGASAIDVMAKLSPSFDTSAQGPTARSDNTTVNDNTRKTRRSIDI